MPKFATGKYAKAISDRSGMSFPYNEMVFEWNGSFVHKSEFEAKAPQVQPGPHPADGIALQNVRTSRTETAVPNLLGRNAFKTGSSSSSTITVTERSHGRSSSDTVRFRDVDSFDGITKANLENSSGYSITKVDDDTYTFSVSSDTATTGNTKGGGGRASAGPVSVTN